MMNLSVLIITILTEITHSALSFQMVVFVLLICILQSKLYTGKKKPRGLSCIVCDGWKQTFFIPYLRQNPYCPTTANPLAAASVVPHHSPQLWLLLLSLSQLKEYPEEYLHLLFFLQTLCFQQASEIYFASWYAF